jgi:tRNA(adenine34) deaminase
MKQALKLAQAAFDAREVPVGACVVYDNVCIGSGYNRTIIDNNPCAHAEINAILAAVKYVGNYRLNNAVLYVTLEPCLMCLGAIIQARVARVVYAAKDTRVGVFSQNKAKNILRDSNHHFTIDAGVLATDASKLLREFFLTKR